MVINPIIGFYIPIIRIPIKGGMTIPQKTRLLTMAQVEAKLLQELRDAKSRAVSWDLKFGAKNR